MTSAPLAMTAMVRPGFECGPVRDRVYAVGESAHDRNLGLRNVVRELLRYLASVGRHPSRTDDGNRSLVLRQQSPADVEHRRRVVDLF